MPDPFPGHAVIRRAVQFVGHAHGIEHAPKNVQFELENFQHALLAFTRLVVLKRDRQTVLDIGENRRLLGQYPPEAEADTSIAKTDLEAETLRWLHEVFNKRMFGKIKDVYAPTVQYHGPMMKELYGVAAVTHQHLGLIGSLPDASYAPQYICSTPSEEGGTKVAVRWIMEGHHLGYGILQSLGEHPTGKRVPAPGAAS